MNLQGGLVLLQEMLDDLPVAEKRVAQHILENPKRFVSLSITQLAEECGTSAAGVVRLCKRLRMTGFRELKLRITLDVSQNLGSQRVLHIEPGVSIDEIITSLIHNNQVILDGLEKTIDTASLERAATRILLSRRVDLYGVGASGVVARDLYQKLLRVGIECSFDPDGRMQITSACNLDENDAVIAISYSGETKVVNAAVEEAKNSGATAISMTRFSQNSLADLSDINLFVPSMEPLIREGAVSSRIAQFVVGDILFSAIASRQTGNLLKKLTRTRDALRERGY